MSNKRPNTVCDSRLNTCKRTGISDTPPFVIERRYVRAFTQADACWSLERLDNYRGTQIMPRKKKSPRAIGWDVIESISNSFTVDPLRPRREFKPRIFSTGVLCADDFVFIFIYLRFSRYSPFSRVFVFTIFPNWRARL